LGFARPVKYRMSYFGYDFHDSSRTARSSIPCRIT
jgi:hypothetical protein